MVAAYQKDDVLIADVQKNNRPNARGFRCWWLGQSGFLIQWRGKHLLFDPYLSDSLSKKYDGTKKPHVRISEQVIAPARLDMVDIVTSSHNHTDHLDGETLIPLFAANPNIQFLIPEANRAFICERVKKPLDFPIGLSDGQSVKIKGFNITGIPAAHNTLDRDPLGRPLYMGFVVQFGKYAVYHSGDTLLFDGMADLLRPYQVDVAFLPINGNDPARGVAGNLDVREAAELGRGMGAKCVVPCHYDMFAFNTADPADFVRHAAALGVGYRVLQIGEGFQVV